MTEESFQQGRKVMASANYRRGMITVAKGQVARWTRMEASFRANLQHGRADGAKKQLEKAFMKLQEARNKFAELKFPPSDLPPAVVERCPDCGGRLVSGSKYISECTCKIQNNDEP
jgi:hypothetical protein